MPDRISVRAEDVAWKSIDEEVVVLDLRTQRYLCLNRSAAILWPMLIAGACRDELADALARTYDIVAAAASVDVEVLLSQLSERDLLNTAGHQPSDRGQRV